MNEPPVPPASAAIVDFKDRRTGLIVFGVLEMLIGGLAALMVPLMILGQIMSAKLARESPPLRQIIPGAVFYFIVAVVLIWLGIGSCKSRRWARALSLVVSWSWLAIGVLCMGAMVLFLPYILKATPSQGQAMPESARHMVMIVVLLFLGFLFVVVPGVLVLFYQRRDVKATCEARDPLPRWTDASPLPVLGLSLWLGFSALTMLTFPLSANGALPVFGRMVSGLVGSLCSVILAALLGYSAWATYRLRAVGWWITLACICLGTASALVTFSQIDLLEMYRVMGYSEKQVEMTRQFSFNQGHLMAYFSLIAVIPLLGYLLFVKRYFPRGGITRL